MKRLFSILLLYDTANLYWSFPLLITSDPQCNCHIMRNLVNFYRGLIPLTNLARHFVYFHRELIPLTYLALPFVYFHRGMIPLTYLAIIFCTFIAD